MQRTLIDSSMTIEEVCVYAISKGNDVTIWIKADGGISVDVNKAEGIRNDKETQS